MDKITLELPFLPPSVNEVYKFNRKTGAMYMVKEAKAFKEGVSKYLSEEYKEEMHKFDTKAIYKATYTFYFLRENLVNDKYGTDKRIKSQYKNLDVDNRVKLLQDSIAFSFGFNDSYIFEFSAKKCISSIESTVITLEKADLKDYQ